MHRREILGSCLAASATTLVGCSVAASSRLVHYPVFSGQAIRYGIAAALLAIIAIGSRQSWSRLSPGHIALLCALAATGTVGFNICLLGAVSHGDPAVVGVVVGCTPVVLAIVSPLLARQRPYRRVIAASIIVATGAALVQGVQGYLSLVTLVFSLGALTGEAAFSLLAVPLLPRLRPVVLSTYLCLISALMFFALAALFDHSRALIAPDAVEAVALGFLTLAVTVVAFICWYSAVDRLGADRAGLFAGIIPITAVFGSTIVGTTSLTLPRIVGTCLVGTGVEFGVTRRT